MKDYIEEMKIDRRIRRKMCINRALCITTFVAIAALGGLSAGSPWF